MYEYPYGNGQQLNLNWIINEIIELHKQLDPEYEAPSFSQIYPFSNLGQLNLDWILSELKALKELAPEPTPELDIQAVAEALVALPFDSTKSYQIYDFISKDGEIWRATEAIAAGGAWDETKWFKTKLGTDLAVLERWINAINASLTTLENTVDELSSADISDDSDAGGATVKASLNNLKGSLNALDDRLKIYRYTGTMPTAIGASNQTTFGAAQMGVSIPSGKNMVLLQALVLNANNNQKYSIPIARDDGADLSAFVMSNSYITCIIFNSDVITPYGGQPVDFIIAVV